MSDKLPTDVQAVLDEWSPDAGNDWQIAMWEAFDKVVREQADTIERLTAEKVVALDAYRGAVSRHVLHRISLHTVEALQCSTCIGLSKAESRARKALAEED